MYKLLKINKLENFRFFEKYKWDPNCDTFKDINLFYGWNGSGKTTISDFLHEYSKGTLPENVRFELGFQDENQVTKAVTHNTIFDSKIKVYHQNYLTENIEEPDKIKSITYIGSEQIEQVKELDVLHDQLEKQKALQNDKQKEKSAIIKQRADFATIEAKKIKETVGYIKSYTRTDFLKKYNQLVEPKILNENEYALLLQQIKESPKPSISPINAKLVQPSDFSDIISILNTSPSNTALQKFSGSGNLKDWLETGLKLHTEDDMVCKFCNNPIDHDRWSELQSYFDDSYTELISSINFKIQQIKGIQENLKNVTNNLPDGALFYIDLQEEYSGLKVGFSQLLSDNIQCLDKIIQILENKKTDVVKVFDANEVNGTIEKINFDGLTILDQINQVIRKHNQESNDYTKKINERKNQIEEHLVSLDFNKLKEFQGEEQRLEREIVFVEQKINELNSQISALNEAIKNTKIPAQKINDDIQKIMGRDELKFEDKENGYLITRNNVAADNLSTGEKNAIALIYFFNSFLDTDADPEHTIIALDDPISSFDSNFYYSAMGYIASKVKDFGQVFILTHKFSLFKDLDMAISGTKRKYMVVRTIQEGKPVPSIQKLDKFLEKYQDEYVYLFNEIYNVVSHPLQKQEEYLKYPNIARRVLECFLSFKIPRNYNNQNTLVDKIIELAGTNDTPEIQSMFRLINNQSHHQHLPGDDWVDNISIINEIPRILRNLLKFIEQYDEKHYKILVEQIGGGDIENTQIIEEQVYSNILQLEYDKDHPYQILWFDPASSAGEGKDVFDHGNGEIRYSSIQCDFATRISGDSMEPKILDESIVLVDKCEEIPLTKEILLVIYDGQRYCKYVSRNQNKHIIELISENKKYNTIEITPENENLLMIRGVVKKIINPST